MKVLRNSVLSIGGSLAPVAIALFTTPLLLATIGPGRYGALAIVWLLLGYFGQADFGIGRAATQRIAQLGNDGQAVARVVWSAVLAVAAFGVVSGLLAYALSWWFFSSVFQSSDAIRTELLSSVGLIALCGPIVALFGVVNGCLQGQERFGVTSTANFVSNTCLPLFPLIAALVLSEEMQVLIAASLAARVLGLAITLGGAWFHTLRRYTIRVARSEISHLFHVGKWIMVSGLVGPLMIVTDRLFIGVSIGAVAVAAYTIPFQVASRTLLFPIGIAQVLYPRLAAMDDLDAEQASQDYTVIVAALFLPVIVALICFAEPLLKLWLGSSLDPRSIHVAQIVLAGIWINGVANVPYSYLHARGQGRFVATLHLFELPVYLVLLVLLSSQFGLFGIAAAFSIRCFIDFWGMLFGAGAGLRQFVASAWIGPVLLMAAFAVQSFETEPVTAFGLQSLVVAFAGAFALWKTPADFWTALRDRLAKRPSAVQSTLD